MPSIAHRLPRKPKHFLLACSLSTMKWIELAASGDVPQVTSGLGPAAHGLLQHPGRAALSTRTCSSGGRRAAARSPYGRLIERPPSSRRSPLAAGRRPPSHLAHAGPLQPLADGHRRHPLPVGRGARARACLWGATCTRTPWRSRRGARWRCRASPPACATRTPAAALGSDLYIFGGRSLGEGAPRSN